MKLPTWKSVPHKNPNTPPSHHSRTLDMRMVSCTVSNKLAPEFANAARLVIDSLHCKVNATTEISSDILNQGNIQKITHNFHAREIPSGDGWRWNQTKARKDIYLEASVHVQFFKLSPRRRGKSCGTPPPMKLWKFNVVTPVEEYFLLWCERGNLPPTITIDDFSFLAPFMADELVLQLWPTKQPLHS